MRTKFQLLKTAGFLCSMSLATFAQKGPPVMPVEVKQIVPTPLVIELSVVGSLIANESVIIRPEISGRIEKIHFEEGDPIRANAIIVSLDSAEYRARLAESSADLKLKELNLERIKSMLEKKLTSEQEHDQETALLQAAIAKRALDQERLRKTVLRAPFHGVLGLRKVSPGDYVKAGDDIVELTDVKALKLNFQIPEVYLRDIRKGQHLSVQVDAFPELTFQGEVFAIAPKLDVASRSIQVRARITNDEGRLRPGMFARVKLQVAAQPQALMIPEAALWPVGNEQFVYRVDQDKAEKVKITLGYRQGGQVEVLSGLKAGDTIVTDGQMKIRHGAAVKVIPAKGSASKE